MRTASTPLAALTLILADAPAGTIFAVSDGMADYELAECFLDDVPEHHRDVDRGGPLHHSYTCMQEVVGGGEARLGFIYTVLGLEGETVAVYWA